MEQIHDGHQGIEKCMLKAREAVFCQGFPKTSVKLWKNMESVKHPLSQLSQLEMLVKFHHMLGTP